MVSLVVVLEQMPLRRQTTVELGGKLRISLLVYSGHGVLTSLAALAISWKAGTDILADATRMQRSAGRWIGFCGLDGD